MNSRASQNQGRRTDVKEVEQTNAFMQVYVKFENFKTYLFDS